MARIQHTTTTEGVIALVAATVKTVLQVVAPTNQRGAFKGFGLYFDGSSGAAVPVLVELLRQTSAGTMSAATPVKDGVGTETIQFTAQKNATVEPSAGDILRRYHFHPTSGYERSFAEDEEILIPGGTRLALRCTAPAAVNVTGSLTVEE